MWVASSSEKLVTHYKTTEERERERGREGEGERSFLKTTY
jgi:hypothetical protein